MFTTPQKYGEQMAKKGRRKALTQDEIDALHQTIASTPKPTWPFVFDQPVAPEEEVQKMIVLSATNTFGRQKYLTPLTPAKFWYINCAEWTHKMDQAKQYCIISNAKVANKDMQNICLVIYPYICCMSTLPDYTDYKLAETEMIVRQLDPPLYNITKCIPWIPQTWPEIQQYLLTGNIYLMGEAALEAASSSEVLFEPEAA